LACPADGAGEDCLRPEQVSAVRTMYAGVTLPDGTLAAHPRLPGSESSWTKALGQASFEVSQPKSVAVFFDADYGYDAAAATAEEPARRVLGSRFGAIQ